MPIWRCAAVVSSAFAVLVMGAGPALAECSPGPTSGNSSPNLSSNRWAYGIWNGGTDSFDLTVNVANGLGDGKCVTAYFDWGTNNAKHFDARAARTCKGNTDRSVNGANDYQELSYANRRPYAEARCVSGRQGHDG
jgi:hypothetical protein